MSAIDQYCEAIPSPGGDRGNTDSDRGGAPIPAAARKALAKSPRGQAILALAGPASQKRAKQAQGRGVAGASIPAHVRPEQRSENPLSALAHGFGETGATAGPLFGSVLLCFALFFFSLAWLRYRRRAQG